MRTRSDQAEQLAGLPRADRTRLEPCVIQQISVARHDRLGARLSRQRDQVVVLGVAKGRLDPTGSSTIVPASAIPATISTSSASLTRLGSRACAAPRSISLSSPGQAIGSKRAPRQIGIQEAGRASPCGSTLPDASVLASITRRLNRSPAARTPSPAHFARRLDGFSLDLFGAHPREALLRPGARFPAELYAGGALQQLAVALRGPSLSQPLQQRAVDLDVDGRRGHGGDGSAQIPDDLCAFNRPAYCDAPRTTAKRLSPRPSPFRLRSVEPAEASTTGASRAKAEHGKDAGSPRSSATWATEDAAGRRLAAASAGGGAPEWVSPSEEAPA